MNPYDILGVPKDADEETIRQAYRKLRGKAHPDRHGGDTKAMVALNVARDILTNPARRERFDLGGEDIPPAPPLELRARMQLGMVFMQIVQQSSRVNIPKTAARLLRDKQVKMLQDIRELKAMHARMQSRLPDVECEDTINTFSDQIHAALAQIDSQAKVCEETAEAIEKALEMLKKYRSTIPESPQYASTSTVWTLLQNG